MSTSTTGSKPSKGKTVRITSASVAVLAAVACGLYFTGTYGSWRDHAEPARLCDGIVPQGELAKFLGMRELTPGDVITDRSTDEPQECSVRPQREGTGKYYDEVDITVSKYAGSRDLLRDLARQMSDSSTQAVSPIGSGWRGVLNSNTHQPRAAIVMLCAGGEEDDSRR
jgi:hypothetical protein